MFLSGMEEAAREGLVLFQGDMLMKTSQFRDSYFPTASGFSGAAVKDEAYRLAYLLAGLKR